jgi:hypothetical protein
MKIFFQANEIVAFGDLNLFSYLVILSEVMCKSYL